MFWYQRHTRLSTAISREPIMDSASLLLPSQSTSWAALTYRRHPWHLNERVVFLLLGSSLFGAWEAYSEIAYDRLKPEWPVKKVHSHLHWDADRQAPFGRVVATTLSNQLEKVLDTSTITRAIAILWASSAFTIAYYVLHKWVWRQILWLTFGSMGSFTINFTRSSRSNLSIGLLMHLLNIELFVVLITKVPVAVMMPYIVQVSRLSLVVH